jgi:hypothetical protein
MNSLDQSILYNNNTCEEQPQQQLTRVNSLVDQPASRAGPPLAQPPGPPCRPLSRVNSSDNTRVNYMDQAVANIMEQQQQQQSGRDSLRLVGTAGQSEKGGGANGGTVTVVMQRQNSNQPSGGGPGPQEAASFSRQGSLRQTASGAVSVGAVTPSGGVQQRLHAASSQVPPNKLPPDGQVSGPPTAGSSPNAAGPGKPLPASSPPTSVSGPDNGPGADKTSIRPATSPVMTSGGQTVLSRQMDP